MSELEKTIAVIGMKIGALEGLIEVLMVTFSNLLPPAYQEDLKRIVVGYEKAVNKLQKEIKDQ